MLKKITTEELISRYAGGERDFRGSNLEDANLEGANLEGANLEDANLKDANLKDANLIGANLQGANLEGADLFLANLEGANLEGANLEGADFTRANLDRAILKGASLEGANLEWADLRETNLEGANLRDSDLYGAILKDANLYRANLEGADLYGAIGLPEIVPFPIDTGIAEAVENEAHLNMESWHGSCGTAHCRAGWAVTLHPQGKKLEVEFGTNAAAALIYNACSISERTPDWYASNAEALADIRRLAELASKGPATPADVQGTP
jgi:hypothetical protein